MTHGMSEQSEALKKRTKRFALDVCRMLKQLPYEEPGPTVRKQLAKSSTSMAANYRSTCRARSKVEFVARLATVDEESDESVFWLEFAIEAELLGGQRVTALLQEATELSKIFSASLGTARGNL
jgi:four helix bundle protein